MDALSGLQKAFGISPDDEQGDNEPHSREAQTLFAKLKDQVDKEVLFGHQDSTAYGADWSQDENRSDVKDVCGKWPAVYGWDIGGIDTSDTNIDGISFDLIRQRIVDAHNRGGINTISFHQDNPVTGESAFDNTDAIGAILDSGCDSAQKYKDRLDKVADFLCSLKTDEGPYIPIIVRLFHEQNQEWSWWGKDSCSKSQFIEIWQHTVNYLRKKRHVKHVLYCFSPQDVSTKEDYLERYPGDDYVDVFGLDFYKVWDEHQMNELENALEMITELAEKRSKVAALSETGIENAEIENWFSQSLLPVLKHEKCSRIVYVLVWRNESQDHFFVPYEGHEGASDFRTFADDGAVKFLEPVDD